jgi:tripartite-type tricarboxylate transporter receptor subunit TctC
MRRALLLILALLPVLAAAQGYPSKPIRFVVPYPPGGPLDLMARAIGAGLTEAWGQPVVVENKPGAGGGIGAEAVARSPGDGYTLLMGAVATHAINPALYASVPYDPLRDFVPVTLVAQVPNILVVHPALPVATVTELIAYARAKPGTLSFGSGSTGSTGHLAGELFKRMAAVDMVHIPYKGGAPAMADLLAGQTQLMFDNLANALPQVRAGKLRGIAVTTLERSVAVPELPTLDEAGLRGFYLTRWFGVFVPAGTSPEVVEKLNAAILRVLDTPALRERFAGMGTAPPAIRTPRAFDAFVRREAAKYADVVRSSGARVE